MCYNVVHFDVGYGKMTERRSVSISLPPEMADLVDRAAKIEHRTRSELIREALRRYFAARRLPLTDVSPEEATEIDRGRREIARGEFVSLEQVLDDLESPPRPAG